MNLYPLWGPLMTCMLTTFWFSAVLEITAVPYIGHYAREGMWIFYYYIYFKAWYLYEEIYMWNRVFLPITITVILQQLIRAQQLLGAPKQLIGAPQQLLGARQQSLEAPQKLMGALQHAAYGSNAAVVGSTAAVIWSTAAAWEHPTTLGMHVKHGRCQTSINKINYYCYL